MFTKYILKLPETIIFENITETINFENITNGRDGAILIDYNYTDNIVTAIPLVRSTTKYKNPAQKFLPIHYNIIDNIKKTTQIENLEFNNALIEIYDNNYRSMGFHSDQAQDLADNSYICLYSCYDYSNSDSDTNTNLRKLKINNKLDSTSTDIILENNSIVIFSLDANQKNLHKIILDSITDNNKWCGITFRMSKTFIKFQNNSQPYFVSNNKSLHMANDIEKKEFYKHRNKENNTINYVYPELDYTISESDLL